MIRLRTIINWLLFTIVLTNIFVPAVSAITETEVQDFFLNTYNPQVNNIIPNIPLVKSVFGGQVIYIFISDPNKNIEMTAITDSNGYITDLKSGVPADPTLKLISNAATIDKIKSSPTPLNETKTAFANGDITYQGVGIVQSVKVAIVKLAEYFARLFGVI
ncbi:MAG: hypothetical protein OIN87_02885 [Candidatus Methanoperedens sp.]|nr:hypothetical protein [Candidatus Methanoperedens sp.]